MYPNINIISTELLLIPFRLRKKEIHFNFNLFFSFKIADVTGRHPKSLLIYGISSNFIYLLWAVFGGFILHFLLSNYLTVLLKPDYEKAVNTAQDMIDRDITPVNYPGSESIVYIFAESTDFAYQILARRIVIAKDWNEYYELLGKALSEGNFASIGTKPPGSKNLRLWHRSTEKIPAFATSEYVGHAANKKWPLRKVHHLF